MALPTVTAVAKNGGPPTGGSVVTITGTNLTGATAVKFGTLSSPSFTVENATTIKATVPQSYNQVAGKYNVGTVNVFATTPEGTNTAEAGNQFVYYPAQVVKKEAGRVYETVPVGAPKAGAEPVSFISAAGIEKLFYGLLGDYSNVQDFEIEYNIVEVNATPKLKISLEDSIDGGNTWFPVEGYVEPAEITAAAKGVQRFGTQNKPLGPLLRLGLNFGAAGGVAGTIVVASGHEKGV